MNKTETLKKFILANSLDFSGYDSDLNGVCTIISGYADYIGVKTTTPIEKAIIATHEGLSEDFKPELKRVFDFAYRYNYGRWWNTSRASKEYKF